MNVRCVRLERWPLEQVPEHNWRRVSTRSTEANCGFFKICPHVDCVHKTVLEKRRANCAKMMVGRAAKKEARQLKTVPATEARSSTALRPPTPVRPVREVAARPIKRLSARMGQHELGLSSSCSTTEVLAVLKGLSAHPGAPAIVCVMDLDSLPWNDACMEVLCCDIMLKFPLLVSLNMGEKCGVSHAAWRRFVATLRDDDCAAVAVFVCDTYARNFINDAKKAIYGQAGYNNRKVYRKQGKRGRREEAAMKLLAQGEIAAARRMVPWRDATVHKAIGKCARVPNEAWAKPFWRPTKTWPFKQ